MKNDKISQVDTWEQIVFVWSGPVAVSQQSHYILVLGSSSLDGLCFGSNNPSKSSWNGKFLNSISKTAKLNNIVMGGWGGGGGLFQTSFRFLQVLQQFRQGMK